jgi:hypothetical protein
MDHMGLRYHMPCVTCHVTRHCCQPGNSCRSYGFLAAAKSCPSDAIVLCLVRCWAFLLSPRSKRMNQSPKERQAAHIGSICRVGTTGNPANLDTMLCLEKNFSWFAGHAGCKDHTAKCSTHMAYGPTVTMCHTVARLATALQRSNTQTCTLHQPTG